ncbi:unnamed protein product [Effrenium voratum]|nr:unnamed protein product [Effrenium voratum]
MAQVSATGGAKQAQEAEEEEEEAEEAEEEEEEAEEQDEEDQQADEAERTDNGAQAAVALDASKESSQFQKLPEHVDSVQAKDASHTRTVPNAAAAASDPAEAVKRSDPTQADGSRSAKDAGAAKVVVEAAKKAAAKSAASVAAESAAKASAEAKVEAAEKAAADSAAKARAESAQSSAAKAKLEAAEKAAAQSATKAAAESAAKVAAEAKLEVAEKTLAELYAKAAAESEAKAAAEAKLEAAEKHLDESVAKAAAESDAKVAAEAKLEAAERALEESVAKAAAAEAAAKTATEAAAKAEVRAAAESAAKAEVKAEAEAAARLHLQERLVLQSAIRALARQLHGIHKVGDLELRAGDLILGCCSRTAVSTWSPSFAALLRDGRAVLELHGDPDAVGQAMAFMQEGRTSFQSPQPDKHHPLLELAHEHGLEDLKVAYGEAMMGKIPIAPENATPYLQLGLRYSVRNISMVAADTIAAHAGPKGEAIIALDMACVQAVLASDQLNVVDEKEVLQIIQAWAAIAPNRLPEVRCLIAQVRLSLCSFQTLIDLLSSLSTEACWREVDQKQLHTRVRKVIDEKLEGVTSDRLRRHSRLPGGDSEDQLAATLRVSKGLYAS